MEGHSGTALVTSANHHGRSVPSAPDLQLHRVAPEDGPAVHELLLSTLPDVPADRARWLAHWQWRGWDNPFRGDHPAGWVLVDSSDRGTVPISPASRGTGEAVEVGILPRSGRNGDSPRAAGRVVGHLGAVYVPLRIGDRRMTGVIGADYAVADHALERGGLFAGLQLAEALFTDVPDVVPMATTANDKTAAVFQRFGCEPVPWTQEFWRAPATLAQEIRSGLGGSNRLIRRMLTGPARAIASAMLEHHYRRRGRRPSVPLPGGCSIETTTPALASDPGWIWEGSAHDRDVISVDRTRAYFEWRYTRHPDRDRIIVHIVRDAAGNALASAVASVDDRPGRRVAFVEELFSLPGRDDLIRALLCAALRTGYDHSCQWIVTMTGQRTIRHLFWELGFEARARSAPAFLIRPPPSSDVGTALTGAALPDALEFWHGEMF